MEARRIEGRSDVRATEQLTGEVERVVAYVRGRAYLEGGTAESPVELRATGRFTASGKPYTPAFPIWRSEDGREFVLT